MTKAPTGTVTFLLTDIAGSTSLWDVSPTQMAAAMQLHDRTLRTVLERHGGHFIKHTGDGICAAFSRVTAAALAASDCRHELNGQTWPTQVPLRVRIVLHTGECFERDHDYFGSPLCIARRLVEITPADSIWTTGVFAQLLQRAPHEDLTLTSLGTRQLKGLSRPVGVYQLDRQQPDMIDVSLLATG